MGITWSPVRWSGFLCSSFDPAVSFSSAFWLVPQLNQNMCSAKHSLLPCLLLQIVCVLQQVCFHFPKPDISWFMCLVLISFSAANSTPLYKGWKKWLFLLCHIFWRYLLKQISLFPSVLPLFFFFFRCKFIKLELKFILLQHVVVSLSTVFWVRAASVKVLKSSLRRAMSAVLLSQETLP